MGTTSMWLTDTASPGLPPVKPAYMSPATSATGRLSGALLKVGHSSSTSLPRFIMFLNPKYNTLKKQPTIGLTIIPFKIANRRVNNNPIKNS